MLLCRIAIAELINLCEAGQFIILMDEVLVNQQRFTRFIASDNISYLCYFIGMILSCSLSETMWNMQGGIHIEDRHQ